jgi:hypothetical protein
MQGLLAKMNAKKLESRRGSRSLSIASSIDMNEDDENDNENNESDESSSNTLK